MASGSSPGAAGSLPLLATLIAGALVYAGARLFAEIHVEAKALAVILSVLLIGLQALLAPPPSGERRATSAARYAIGVAVLACATLSTLLALRAPVGFDDRAAGLEQTGERAEGESVAFLGVDRFAGYRLRGTLARAPAGYVPGEIESRPEKRWQQGDAADFDNLDSGKLDKFRYAITTGAAYASAPPNFEPVLEADDYLLWQRRRQNPAAQPVARRGRGAGPGRLRRAGRPRALASVFALEPALADS